MGSRKETVKAALADVTAGAIRKPATKTAQINLRATPEEKASLEATAAKLGLTVSEYIFALHEYAAERIGRKKGK